MELSEMLVAARANLWRAQERLGVKPKLVIVINDEVVFKMDEPGIYRKLPVPWLDVPEPYLKCTMSTDLLRRILTRETHWNNAELAFDITFDRKGPYMPDVHTLMSFFHV